MRGIICWLYGHEVEFIEIFDYISDITLLSKKTVISPSIETHSNCIASHCKRCGKITSRNPIESGNVFTILKHQDYGYLTASLVSNNIKYPSGKSYKLACKYFGMVYSKENIDKLVKFGWKHIKIKL